ncbi:SRPBCC family protein [Lentzea sp. NPDC060358]|uniref:SRPBCC family protein n=1 Tax=Lentzea sp. NPDC060358 TaxID=3347103 RepID=UPI003663FD44
MRFTKQVVLDQPIERVRALTSDPDHPRHWQPDLVGITRRTGTPGAPGATATLKYRTFTFEETVLSATADERVSRNEMTGMVHTITNRFSAIDDRHTLLVCDNEFELSGLLRLAGRVLEKTLREQVERNVAHFKAFIDAG